MENTERTDAPETTTTTDAAIQPESRLRLSSPWITFYSELRQLFGEDNEIRIAIDESSHIVRLYVENPLKAEALRAILPAEKVFGNITVKVDVIPANEEASPVHYYEIAFQGNPVVTRYITLQDTALAGTTFVMFRKEVVQFFNDNLLDPFGNRTTLFEDIAGDVFDAAPNIRFATDPRDPEPADPADTEDED